MTRVAQPPEAIVRQAALEAGFDAVGIARLSDLGEQPGRRLDAFLADGRHGDMAWMATHAARRRHPNALWPEARSAVVCALNYGPETDPMAALDQPGRGVVSVYARGRDYHDIVKGRLRQVASVVQRATGGADVKIFVDTAPLMEKPLAALAGLGWQGRHTNLVARGHGSWLFLGAVLTTASLEPDARHGDHCGSCRRCLDICPTDAFPAAYQLDARRCIAYLTIEHKGPIPRELRAPIGNRVFGCDDCLAVCPWNKFAQAARESRLAGGPATDNPPLPDLLALDDAAFRQRFAGTPVKRTGRDRFLRNVLVAAGNSGDRALIPLVEPLLRDGSALVRGAAVWALGRLVDRGDLAAHADRCLSRETDDAVRAEWQAEADA
ncbi:MAG: tRNA epoxyqueuosine(34) reductase QueG [Hyphomicrobiaceae bacterium]|nr:tRNA epoxyqueuosine(34) reductase QueG [Hyphomicrobiaceae bacterium]